MTVVRHSILHRQIANLSQSWNLEGGPVGVAQSKHVHVDRPSLQEGQIALSISLKWIDLAPLLTYATRL